ncbi:GNAT family N-acetyltransferase [Shewanella woodyi]|uniref:GNAT family N-acetyltransferase n=1 Tax=Shewanella woodyi TaxID=60961 RepID=UPI0037478896
MIKVREFNAQSSSSDIDELWTLKFNTIRKVNCRDYTQAQVKAWAPDRFDRESWLKRVSEMAPLIAEVDGVVVGFADLQVDGYIDHFFCHLDYQGRGVGKTLMKALMEKGVRLGVPRYYSHVSITARPFFEHFGFTLVKQQSVEVRGEALTNYVLEKIV